MTAVGRPVHRPAAWAVVASGLAVVAVAFGLSRYGYGLLLPQMRDSLGLDLAALGVIGAGSYASYLVASLAVSRLVARCGLRWTVVLGGAAATGGMLLCAAATGPVSLGAGIALAGVSSALVWPPYIAAVQTHLAAGRRPGAHGLINSGTGYGVAVAGPLSLLAGSSWRTVWIVFAVLAAAVTAWCALVLGPHRPLVDTDDASARLWPVAARQGPRLLTTAVLLGLVGGCYWTFGVQAATAAAPVGSSSGAVFQLVVGLSGVAGGAVGALLSRATLPRLLGLAALALGAACLLLTTGRGWLVLPSAAFYGAAFIAAIGLLVIWNTRLVPDAAATGLATAMLAMGAGLVIGPPLAGAAADTWGTDAVFLACVPLSIAVAALSRDPRTTPA
ncbi:MFS transporter [Geodermatophilus sp. DSM 44513]|uniref:MFS transporter n=1 Tax=Geodermatophilus sp. DSM 44513 TaxID=1528104 RepID=UPI0012748308|nr:MFS transporter [Geodermatophilus sp. DSM 44513]WNV77802.1 MFS transporter [Geodermatophilus sp. DSM 44513]